jgi:hypothetical protein
LWEFLFSTDVPVKKKYIFDVGKFDRKNYSKILISIWTSPCKYNIFNLLACVSDCLLKGVLDGQD